MNLLTYLFIQHAPVLLQSLETSDVTNLMSAGDLTVNGLLLIAIIMLWRRLNAAEEKIDQLRKEKDNDVQKYIDLVTLTSKIVNDNTRMYERLEKILDK